MIEDLDDDREYIPRKRVLWECECGFETEQLDPLPRCECGHVRCPECTQQCEWCLQLGCRYCMTLTDDGWAHADECAANLKASEERKNARIADRIKRAAKRAASAA